ncbi:hypothetical protein ABEF92_001821 [Exophiala dermatitidis]
MEHNQEHIATLCAVGTVAIAAAGLSLGTSDGDSYLIKPGKRKAPGSNATARSPFTAESQRVPTPPSSHSVSTPPAVTDRSERRLSSSIFRRKTIRTSATSTTASIGTESRESSMSRHGIPRPWTSDKEGSDMREQRPSSSWLRRISSISRGSHGSPASSSSRLDESPAAWRPSINELEQPNKLVKRSSSGRLLQSEGKPPALLRRPATSHQRSATLSGLPYTRPLTTESAIPARPASYVTQPPLWRPFFESGYARKRHSSGGARESLPRTISMSLSSPPTLLKGGSVERREAPDLEDDRPGPADLPLAQTNRRHKMRRTLASVRKGAAQRHFTDPIVRVNKDEAYGSMVPPTAFSSLSPLSNVSAFEVDLPPGTPAFTSSPPVYGASHHRFTVPKRISVAPSDPTTTSSDNDPRVFTDDDSMDFQSDTAYDSLATRATASSHSGFRPPKIETIFDEASVDQQHTEDSALEDMMQRTTLTDFGPLAVDAEEETENAGIGIGISGLAGHVRTRDVSPDQASTPVREPLLEGDDAVSTPVPRKGPRNDPILASSPPSVRPYPRSHHEEPELPRMMDLDEDDNIEWSPDSVQGDPVSTTIPLPSPVPLSFDQIGEDDFEEPRSNKRSSIFDWAESHAGGSDHSNGVSPRPKTVHSKQGNNAHRSRPSGRKSNAAMHLRSQSVPVNRDSLADSELATSATKFGTWALGSKPVSEEWSDDFEFDDADEGEGMTQNVMEEKAAKHESVRSVKVPQSIIERQQSVHIQFGQVREFMLLVEELRRLRARGAALGLLESHSRQLWEDAGSIIDLATVNEDEETGPRPSSPGSSDIFGEETPPPKREVDEDVGKNSEGVRVSNNRRSISSPATPPCGRPRGESLQTKTFLQTIQQSRNGVESSPAERYVHPREKLPFDTQDLRNLVVRAGVITRALKEIVRKAEGVSFSPEVPTNAVQVQDLVFRQIFDPPGSSPSPALRKPHLPKSRSANSYLDGASTGGSDHEVQQPLNLTKVVEAV